MWAWTPAVAFQSGRIDFDFTPTCRRECWFDRAQWVPYCSDNGIALTVRRVNPKDPLRNIRVLAPGFLATHEILPFHPYFLRQLTRYSTLRCMHAKALKPWTVLAHDAYPFRRTSCALLSHAPRSHPLHEQSWTGRTRTISQAPAIRNLADVPPCASTSRSCGAGRLVRTRRRLLPLQ